MYKIIVELGILYVVSCFFIVLLFKYFIVWLDSFYLLFFFIFDFVFSFLLILDVNGVFFMFFFNLGFLKIW